MPFSYSQFTGNGSTSTYTVAFPYLVKAHVKLYYGLNLVSGGYTTLLVDGTNYSWINATQVQITPAPPNGTVLTIRRETPTTNRLVDWSDGSALNASDLDTADLQNFYAIQEHKDFVESYTLTPSANVADGSITANKISTAAVTTEKVADGSITANKISTAAVTTEKLASGIAPIVISINGGPLAGSRNRIINGGMNIDQRNNGGSLSSGVNAVTYSVDRWYVYALGAAVTAQRVGSSASLFQSALRINGATSNTTAVIGQRIERANSFDLANQVVSLSFVAASSASITLTWTILYADAPDNFTSKTVAHTGTQATTPLMTGYFATFTLPATATTGLAVEFQVANFTSGSIDITGVQLEPGSAATPFERRSYGQELALCQRYFYRPNISYAEQSSSTGGGDNQYTQIFFPVTMRATPSIVASWGSGTNAIAGSFLDLAQVGASSSITSAAAGNYAAVITWTSFNAEL